MSWRSSLTQHQQKVSAMQSTHFDTYRCNYNLIIKTIIVASFKLNLCLICYVKRFCHSHCPYVLLGLFMRWRLFPSAQLLYRQMHLLSDPLTWCLHLQNMILKLLSLMRGRACMTRTTTFWQLQWLPSLQSACWGTDCRANHLLRIAARPTHQSVTLRFISTISRLFRM